MDIPSDPVPKNFDAKNAPNLPEIEKQFAVRCIEQAETYWNLLGAIHPKNLKLTKYDDEIVSEFKEAFPDLYENKDGKLQQIDEQQMKSPEGKEAWRKYIAKFDKNIVDFNFGTLIRTNSAEDYTESNTMFITRIQFYAIEICRNRLGLNDKAHILAKKEWEQKKAKKGKQ
ncbi:polysaccharide biosynthesis-domain-containing protein [Phakopsora pachyrhizi]|uniref:Polysaccharide biosynthesis-domain-containing protein n=1 Tax=Phakopsora pachyrhizi TaxID=170000 RepID=A0AAV0AT63_PHAPC|nr:polysaccharide biosynthesis-domain-containing protein [Phakopsora pachyrhizi]CAH7671363.1 polysaccharide biosynthesis-domain-containing protein [Phakopsora pachyrhizi]